MARSSLISPQEWAQWTTFLRDKDPTLFLVTWFEKHFMLRTGEVLNLKYNDIRFCEQRDTFVITVASRSATKREIPLVLPAWVNTLKEFYNTPLKNICGGDLLLKKDASDELIFTHDTCGVGMSKGRVFDMNFPRFKGIPYSRT